MGRSATDLSTRCASCLVRRDLCLCDRVPRIRNRTRVVIVRHALEAFRSTNTGRIAMLALENAVLVDHGGRPGTGLASLPEPLADPGAWMLFPDGAREPDVAPRTIVVVDASWSQARRMVQRVERLRSMPRFAVSPGPSLPRLRIAPRGDGMSTIEAISRALARFEAPDVSEALDALCRLHAERSRAGKGL